MINTVSNVKPAADVVESMICQSTLTIRSSDVQLRLLQILRSNVLHQVLIKGIHVIANSMVAPGKTRKLLYHTGLLIMPLISIYMELASTAVQHVTQRFAPYSCFRNTHRFSQIHANRDRCYTHMIPSIRVCFGTVSQNESAP